MSLSLAISLAISLLLSLGAALVGVGGGVGVGADFKIDDGGDGGDMGVSGGVVPVFGGRPLFLACGCTAPSSTCACFSLKICSDCCDKPINTFNEGRPREVFPR